MATKRHIIFSTFYSCLAFYIAIISLRARFMRSHSSISRSLFIHIYTYIFSSSQEILHRVSTRQCRTQFRMLSTCSIVLVLLARERGDSQTAAAFFFRVFTHEKHPSAHRAWKFFCKDLFADYAYFPPQEDYFSLCLANAQLSQLVKQSYHCREIFPSVDLLSCTSILCWCPSCFRLIFTLDFVQWGLYKIFTRFNFTYTCMSSQSILKRQ